VANEREGSTRERMRAEGKKVAMRRVTSCEHSERVQYCRCDNQVATWRTKGKAADREWKGKSNVKTEREGGGRNYD
jgi:hypothetical protein